MRNVQNVAHSEHSMLERRRAVLRQAVERLEDRCLMAAHVAGDPAIYATIQAAVDAAPTGATLTVDAGTYPELVSINKTLTLRGAQAGVDARANIRAAANNETVVTGFTYSDGTRSGGFYVNANDVTLDGFTVQGNTNSTGICPAGVVIAPKISGAHILDNIVQNNVTGLYLANYSAADAALIQHNLFKNNNNPGNNSGRGIYSDGGVSGGNLTNVVIDGNAIIVNKIASGGPAYEGGIALESRTLNSQSNITITNNMMDGDGKLLIYNASNITVEYNIITHCTDQWSGSLRFEGGVVNATIKYNTVYDNTGPGLSVDAKGFGASDSGFTVNYNNFFNNNTAYGNKYSLAVTAVAYDGTFNAQNNWWGNASGPSGQGPGTGDMVWGNGLYAHGAGSSWSTGAGSEIDFSNWSTAPNGSIDAAYWGVPAAEGAPIQAEDFDHGGEGIGYHDADKNNIGGQYRKGESVDIEASTDTGGGYDVGWTPAGEWLKYSVNLTQGGTYNASFRLADGATVGGSFHLEVDGQNVTGAITAPLTGGWQTWQTVTRTGINLTSGPHVLRLVMDTNGNTGMVANFNWLQLTNVNPIAAPAAPGNLQAATAGLTTVNLTWQANSTNQTAFLIERSADGVNFTQVGTAPASATTYSDTSVSSGTAYSYRVRASGVAGNSAYSNIAAVVTPAIPSAPSNLTAVAVSATQVNLAWKDTAAGVENGFLIERSTDGITFAQIGSSAQGVASFSDNTAAGATTYTYRVRAAAPAADSAYSNSATATTPVAGAIVTYVSDLAWVSATSGWGAVHKDQSVVGNAITLNGVTYPKGLGTHAVSQMVYNLQGAFSNFVSDVGIDGEEAGKGPAAVDFQVLGDGKVLFDTGVLTNSSPTMTINVNVSGVQQLTLLASNGVVNSIDYDHADWAGARLLSSPTAIPAAPTGLTATAASSSQINLSWTNNALNATGFLIERGTDGINFTQVASTASGVTSYSDTGLIASTSYVYRVRAAGAGGTSGYSNASTASTLAAAAVSTYLSDINWVSATAGWGSVQKNTSVIGNPIKLRGVVYAKGLGTHAASQIAYALNGQYSNFLSDVGIDDEELTRGQGSVDFQVIGDGKVLFDSGVLTNTSATVSINVSVAGVQQLTLVASNGIANNIDYDHADWAGARLLATPPAPAPVAAPAIQSAALAPAAVVSFASVQAPVAGIQTPAVVSANVRNRVAHAAPHHVKKVAVQKPSAHAVAAKHPILVKLRSLMKKALYVRQ